tara:strand:+ start:2669 stop:2893 length:225 start_codon:yes stop_codon:yes gene_type:complete
MKILIEKDVKDTGRTSKYQQYIDTVTDMEIGDSFVVDDFQIVDALRHYAWRQGCKVTYRTLNNHKYRVWKRKDK